MSADLSLINKFVTFAARHFSGRNVCAAAGGFPGFAAVAGALDDLAEPAAGLRGKNAIRISRRAFEMVNLPSGKVRTGDLPIFALAVRGEDECAFFRADQQPYFAHNRIGVWF